MLQCRGLFLVESVYRYAPLLCFSSHDFLSSLSVCLHRTARAPGSHTVSLQALSFAVLVLLMKWLMFAGLCEKRLVLMRAVNGKRLVDKPTVFLLVREI